MVRSLVFMGAIAEAADDFGMLQATKLAEEQSTMLKTESSTQQSLTALSRAQDPRRAAELLQEFAMNSLNAEMGVPGAFDGSTGNGKEATADGTRVNGLDPETKRQLIVIRDILTNETYLALEQAHRSDQDLLNKHAKAINECGSMHIRHMQQDVEGQEVQLVRDAEDAMYKCMGLPTHSVAVLQRPDQCDEECAKDEWAGQEHCCAVIGEVPCGHWEKCAQDEWGNYDPDKDPTGEYALQAIRSHPDDAQITKGVWRNGAWNADQHRFWSSWTGINDPKYNDPNWQATGSCLGAHKDMFARCDALHDFIDGLPKPNCDPAIGDEVMAAPTCGDRVFKGLDTDLEDWFSNMQHNSNYYKDEWLHLKAGCDNATAYWKEIGKECKKKQHMYEEAFCTYRQSLHDTCRQYQGCRVLNEEEYMALLNQVFDNMDGRKIDWKAIHKIECYINVLISSGVKTNKVRAQELLNCENGNLNTLESILTGFNETNYLTNTKPVINQSCWDLDIPAYIDWKECDMTSVQQHPCTEGWMGKYHGLLCADECTECAPIPDGMQYHGDTGRAKEDGHVDDRFGGGWYFVNEAGRSVTDIDDIRPVTAGGYHLPEYNVDNLQWNEVLIERLSLNWCDSWGKQSSYWQEEGGASMCIQSDEDFVYCMNNANGGHSWRQEPTSHFTKTCGRAGQPACECWPQNNNSDVDRDCFSYWRPNITAGPTLDNIPAPRSVRILSMKTDPKEKADGSVVKISFQGAMKHGVLKIGHYLSFVQDGLDGCKAIGDVKYRVFVRCLGCHAKENEFHTKAGVELTSPMTSQRALGSDREDYTYEAWFKSPMAGTNRREIFGGVSSGLTLVNEGKVECLHEIGTGLIQGGKMAKGYQLHAGGTTIYGSKCLRPDTWYHGAVTKKKLGDGEYEVKVYINGKDVSEDGKDVLDASNGGSLASTIGGGFTDGGQLFNVRIWSYARQHSEIDIDAFVTTEKRLAHKNGLDHWWPLTDDLKDVITGLPLEGGLVRDSPIWCTDLEKSGMKGC